MATNLALDDNLFQQAVAIGGLKTKKDTVTLALKEFIQRREAEKLIANGAYEEAVKLWDNEIENLYREWKKGTEGETRRIAENEQAAFIHQMAALEASLSLICSGKDVQAIAAEERTEKCVGLCFELHTAPEDRPDSADSREGSR